MKKSLSPITPKENIISKESLNTDKPPEVPSKKALKGYDLMDEMLKNATEIYERSNKPYKSQKVAVHLDRIISHAYVYVIIYV